jgi:Zn-dependent protease
MGSAAVLIHAFAQAAASRALGLGTGSMTFTLFGGYFQSKDLEPLPFQMDPARRRRYAVMIFAGPLSNFLLFAAVTLISLSSPSLAILQDFGKVNLYIGLASLLPLYPLDGWRLILSWGRSSASRQRLHVTLSIALTLAAVVAALVAGSSWLLGLAVIIGIQIIRFSLKTNAELENYIYPSESDRGTACPGCGAHLPPVSGPTDRYGTASPACWARHVELMASLKNHGGGGPFGELIVDAYAVQHPGDDAQNVYRSVAVHLLTLHGVLDRGVNPEQAPWIRGRAARRGSRYHRLLPPSFRTTPKIGSLLEAPESECPARAEQYVRGVWAAWATEYRRVIEKWYDQEVLAEF